jgi:hypothetical protein
VHALMTALSERGQLDERPVGAQDYAHRRLQHEPCSRTAKVMIGSLTGRRCADTIYGMVAHGTTMW